MRNDAEKEWEQFRDAVCEVAEQKIGYKKKIVKKWITPATLAKQEEVMLDLTWCMASKN